MSDYRIRAMEPEDVDLAVEWAAAEGGGTLVSPTPPASRRPIHADVGPLRVDQVFGVTSFELG